MYQKCSLRFYHIKVKKKGKYVLVNNSGMGHSILFLSCYSLSSPRSLLLLKYPLVREQPKNHALSFLIRTFLKSGIVPLQQAERRESSLFDCYSVSLLKSDPI